MLYMTNYLDMHTYFFLLLLIIFVFLYCSAAVMTPSIMSVISLKKKLCSHLGLFWSPNRAVLSHSLSLRSVLTTSPNKTCSQDGEVRRGVWTHLSWWTCPPPGWFLGCPAGSSPSGPLNSSCSPSWIWKRPRYRFQRPSGRRRPSPPLLQRWEPWFICCCGALLQILSEPSSGFLLAICAVKGRFRPALIHPEISLLSLLVLELTLNAQNPQGRSWTKHMKGAATNNQLPHSTKAHKGSCLTSLDKNDYKLYICTIARGCRRWGS